MLKLDSLPIEILLLVADYIPVKYIRNLYECNKYLEESFTEKYVLFYFLKRISKENRRYSQLIFSRLGRTLVAHTLGNFHELNEPDIVAIDLNHHVIS